MSIIAIYAPFIIRNEKGVAFMKRTQTILIITVIVSVFLLSFLIGRAAALKERTEKNSESQLYDGTVLIPNKTEEDESVQTSKKTDGVEVQIPEIEKKEKEVKETPPERVLFPCGEKVQKEYSQMAVYSKTMDDWRAHTGIDYEAEKGTAVISVWDGTVKRVYKDKLWGYTVEIRHSGNLVSIYKNLQPEIKIKEGEKIKKGQAIAKVGDSAAVESREAPHLHFELWQDGVPINPVSYVY